MKKFILSIAIFFLFNVQSFSHVEHYKNYNYLEYELFRNNKSIGFHKYDFNRDGENLSIKSEVSFKITRTKTNTSTSDVKTTVYVSTSESSAYEDDYQALSLQPVEFKKTTANTSEVVVTVQTKADSECRFNHASILRLVGNLFRFSLVFFPLYTVFLMTILLENPVEELWFENSWEMWVAPDVTPS